MARFQVSSWAFVTICFGLVFWVVALGGIGGVTYECGQKGFSSNVCARGMQYEWYTVWFELFLLMTLLVLGYSERFHTYKPALLAFLVLVTNCLMWSARSFMTVSSFPDMVGKYTTKNAAAAGFVVLCIVNYVLIWVVGTSDTSSAAGTYESYNSNKGMASDAQHPVV